MPVISNHLTTAATTTDATSYATASISPAANQLILAFFSWEQATPGTATASGNGLTWVEVATRTQGSQIGYVFRALGASPSSGAITFTISGGTGTPSRASWSIAEFNNVDTTGTNGSAAVVQSAVNSSASANALTVTLAAFGSVDNATYGGTAGTGTLSFAATQGTGFTELGEANTDGIIAESEFRNDNDTSVDWSYNETDRILGIAVEIKFVAAVVTKGLPFMFA